MLLSGLHVAVHLREILAKIILQRIWLCVLHRRTHQNALHIQRVKRWWLVSGMLSCLRV